MHAIGVFNRDGGTLRTMDMTAFCAQASQIFADRGHSIECRVVSGAEIGDALRRAAGEVGDGVLLAAGGDGTISAAADLAFSHGVTLAVLPAGTMNLFARAVHIPLDLTEALIAIAEGEVRAVDIATANKKPFVHQFGVGIHARLVRIREGLSYTSRWGKMLASLRAIAAASIRPPLFDVEIRTRRGLERRQVSGIAVSNNPVGEGHIPYADRLDGGVLGVYIAKPMDTAALARLTIAVIRGHWKSRPEVLEREVAQLSLNFPEHKGSAQAVIDGELVDLDRTVALEILPGALKVVVPKSLSAKP